MTESIYRRRCLLGRLQHALVSDQSHVGLYTTIARQLGYEWVRQSPAI